MNTRYTYHFKKHEPLQLCRSLEQLEGTTKKARIYIDYRPKIPVMQGNTKRREYFKGRIVGLDENKVIISGRLKLLRIYKKKTILKVRMRRSTSNIDLTEIKKIKV